ncbi:ribosome modulation factor [Halofilum ochraceum]|nr:Rmf/CrpP family protein [Halofilum ochraceum]
MPEKDPADEGREAYMNGEPLSACPYEGDEAAEWEGGWMEAEEEGA